MEVKQHLDIMMTETDAYLKQLVILCLNIDPKSRPLAADMSVIIHIMKQEFIREPVVMKWVPFHVR